MRAIDVTVDSLPTTIPLEQLYISTNVRSGDASELDFVRIPTWLLSTAASLELVGAGHWSRPALGYWALPDGLGVGVAEIVVDDAGPEKLLSIGRTNQPKAVGAALWSWRRIAGDWTHLTLSGSQLAKKTVERFRTDVADLIDPPTLFRTLDSRVAGLALPGSLVIVEATDLLLSLSDRQAYTVLLENDRTDESLFFRYEVAELV